MFLIPITAVHTILLLIRIKYYRTVIISKLNSILHASPHSTLLTSFLKPANYSFVAGIFDGPSLRGAEVGVCPAQEPRRPQLYPVPLPPVQC